MRKSIFIVVLICGLMVGSSASAQTGIGMRSGSVNSGNASADSARMSSGPGDAAGRNDEEPQVKMQNKAYPSLGGTLGTPAGLNLVGGYYFGDIGVRGSIGYWGALYGAQLNIVRNISSGRSFTHNVSIVAGYSYLRIRRTHFEAWEVWEDTTTYTWRYVGATYALNWNGFFAEVGVSIGSGSYLLPQLLIQLGYVYDFRF